jgi:uncharacterized protein YjiS (DUF1127 family)
LERIVMSHYLHGESAAGFAGGRAFPWRAFLNGAAATARTWLMRRQQRQELLDYMATDHRATADIGVAGNDARDWAKRPFWQP